MLTDGPIILLTGLKRDTLSWIFLLVFPFPLGGVELVLGKSISLPLENRMRMGQFSVCLRSLITGFYNEVISFWGGGFSWSNFISILKNCYLTRKVWRSDKNWAQYSQPIPCNTRAVCHTSFSLETGFVPQMGGRSVGKMPIQRCKILEILSTDYD